VLLVALAGVFVRALQRAGATDPGFDARGVELVSLDASMGGYTEDTEPRLWRDLVERVRRLPGVEAATVARTVPGGFEGIGLGGVGVEDAGAPNGRRSFSPSWNIVEPGYFTTLRIPLAAGRDFAATDGPGSPPVAIVGQAVARRLWPGRSAVGRFFSREAGGKESTLLVVGVAADVKSSSLVDGLAESFVYLPLQQNHAADMTAGMMIVIRTAPRAPVTDQVRSVVASVDPRLPVVRSQTLGESVSLGVAPQRVAASLAGSLGLVGLLLAGTGLYGMTNYTVVRRRREIGIRMALGARRRDVLRLVVGQGVWMAGVGCMIGVALAAAARQVLSAFLFDTPALDPLPFAWAVALLALIALLASWVPARAAMMIDPQAALRYE
jgi:predicted permease